MRTLCLLLCYAAIALNAAPVIRVSKPVALLDEEITIEVRGVNPFQHIVLRAEATDGAGVHWSSEAVYCADEKGRVRLGRNAPLDGSYSGVDGMGLFWSLRPDSVEPVAFQVAEETAIELTLIIDRQPVALKEITRLKKSRAIQKIEVKEKGLRGRLFLAHSKKPLPVILMLSGEGALYSEVQAELLASHGFAVFALRYFGEEGLPTHLEKIPLEYFGTALQWIQAHLQLDGTRVALWGDSRGSEVALLLGTLFPEAIQAIAATSPTALIFGAFGTQNSPAWTYQGKSVSPTPFTLSSERSLGGKDPKTPLQTTPLILDALKANPEWGNGRIPVEKIRCPLLLISGGDDQVWPSFLFAEQIKEQLKQKESKISCRHLSYPRAGHSIGIPFLPPTAVYYHPSSALWLSNGGSLKEIAQANRDAWRKMIVFFESRLQKSKK